LGAAVAGSGAVSPGVGVICTCAGVAAILGELIPYSILL
jgi:hypothetical protein